MRVMTDRFRAACLIAFVLEQRRRASLEIVKTKSPDSDIGRCHVSASAFDETGTKGIPILTDRVRITLTIVMKTPEFVPAVARQNGQIPSQQCGKSLAEAIHL